MKFVHEKNINPFLALASSIGPQGLDVTLAALKHGAYVAGGCARVACSSRSLDAIDNKPATLRLIDYLDVHNHVDVKEFGNPHYRRGRGDIDVFFSNVDSLGKFLNSSELRSVECVRTTNYAQTHVTTTGALIQVITGFIHPIKEQLSRFDLLNAMVAFNDKEVIAAEGWREADDAAVLNIVNWAGPFIVSRAAKWIRRHRLRSIAAETASRLAERALETGAELRQQPIKTSWGSWTTDRHFARLKQLLPYFDDRSLLLLTSAYAGDEYQSAFQELHKRHTLP